jgi:uncharacterized protein with von Willebrand factor type A (vWA) domain
MIDDATRPIAHFLGFTALLRRAGFAIAPEQTIAWLSAIELLGPEEIGDIRRAARATLAPPPERFAEFDALFDAHFLGSIVPGLEGEPSEEEPLKAAEDSSVGPEPIFGEETRESGAQATTAERLSARRFGAGGEGETLRVFARALPARMPKRRGYRWRSARGGAATDARRMFRDAMRHAGEIISLRHRQRRLRQRRIVVLIDVSGSMKERTQAHLAFAHALVRAADSVEVFTMGTRLTRITRPLRLRNREQALATASLLVADWDGGTRIGARRGFGRALGWTRARRPDRHGRRDRAFRPLVLAHHLADAACGRSGLRGADCRPCRGAAFSRPSIRRLFDRRYLCQRSRHGQ